ncbi:hypothetical protein ElyMa_001482800 [Elysia marginata]|uniref:Uncharacterized protein n=1 Tax=Elysia marginata TaxID=1093978 RepID=A0AAV4J263_9GAST|nr:hypothetical protein ElyMa_001482800 [Elysia marginata]
MIGLGQFFFHNRRAINAQTYADVLQAHVYLTPPCIEILFSNKATQEHTQPDTLNSFLSKATFKFCRGQHFRRTLIQSNIREITCRGGWTVKTIDLKTPMILNIAYEGTGMLLEDIFTDSSIFDGTSMCCCTGSQGGTHIACLDL